MRTRLSFRRRERGAALIVALIFLIVLTLLGTAGAINNTLQEHMASNTRNRDLAFQAAEHALDAADQWMRTQTKSGLAALLDPNGDGNYSDQVTGDGIRPNGEQHANDADYWRNSFDWTSTDHRSADTDLAQIAAQPRYVVEKMPSYTDGAGVTHDYYRVTARGVGGTSDAVVILQTMYRFD